MKRVLGAACLAAAMFLSAGVAWSQVEAGLGAGVFYNKMLGSIENDDWKIDDDYLSYLVSLRVQFLTFLGAEAILNYYPGSGSIDYQVTPMGTAILNLLGDLVNVGVGINKTYIKYDDPLGGSDSEWSDLSYHFKAGVQLPLGPLWLDVDAYYFVDQLKNIEDFDKDYLTFGARAHFRF